MKLYFCQLQYISLFEGCKQSVIAKNISSRVHNVISWTTIVAHSRNEEECGGRPQGNSLKTIHSFPIDDDGAVLAKTKLSDQPEMFPKSCYGIFI